MKIEGVFVKRFRSIDKGALNDTGKFNVLIGKNNAGKSSLLSAIDSFFVCIQGGAFIQLSPPIGAEIDYFEKNKTLPIELTIQFRLSNAEIAQIIQDVVSDAPQMRNAAENLYTHVYLNVAVTIPPSTLRFAYVSNVSLTQTKGQIIDSSDVSKPQIILKIGEEASVEMRSKLHSAEQLLKDSESVNMVLGRLDEEDWSRMLKGNDASQVTRLLSSIHRMGPTSASPISQNLINRIREIIRTTKSYEDFRTELEGLAQRLLIESDANKRSPLTGNKITTFSGEEEDIPGYARSLIKRVSELNVLYLTERRKPIGEEEARRLLSLKVRRGGTETMLSIKQTVNSLLGVDIDAFESAEVTRNGKAAELDVDNFLVQANGSGVREALRLILDYEFEKPQILLVEEPEVHLHPALETGMMRYLKRISSDCQVFITTHSTNFLDTAEMGNVYLISKQNTTSAQHLNLEEAEEEIPKELGIRLSSLFMFDRLVFVEGPSDESMLRELASTLGQNLSQANLGFVHMGGVRNFAHFAAEKILAFLTKRQVAMWFLMDRDEKDDPEIATFKERLKGKAKVEFLPKREMENYLIVPRAITEFIVFKRSLSPSDSYPALPDETDLIATIDACADKLKQLVIDKHIAKIVCVPAYPSMSHIFNGEENSVATERIAQEIQGIINKMQEAIGKIPSVQQEQEGMINGIWNMQKLNIVPGDTLIDNVCQLYGVRFKKERDGAKLASLLKTSEIDADLRRIIISLVA